MEHYELMFPFVSHCIKVIMLLGRDTPRRFNTSASAQTGLFYMTQELLLQMDHFSVEKTNH